AADKVPPSMSMMRSFLPCSRPDPAKTVLPTPESPYRSMLTEFETSLTGCAVSKILAILGFPFGYKYFSLNHSNLLRCERCKLYLVGRLHAKSCFFNCGK